MRENRTLRAFSLIEISVVILIIGILIIGVVQTSKLVTNSKLKSARSLTQSSPVASIPGLYAWFETTLLDSYTEEDSIGLSDGDVIGTWNDINPQNKNKFIFTQSNVGSRPIYDNSSTLGIPTLLFDGINDGMTTTIDFGLTGNPDFTVFVVASIKGGNYGALVNFGAGGSTCSWMMFGKDNNSSENGQLFNGFYAGGQNYTHSSLGGGSIFAIHSWRRDSNGGNNNNHTGNTVFTNGTQQTLVNEGTTCVPNITTSSLATGADLEGRDINANIGEIIIFNRALKAEERAAVEWYLSQKWGIKL